MRCTITGQPYTVFGYGGKQVRDNIHSADLVAAFEAFAKTPRAAAVYNLGGGRACNCSMLEAIRMCEEIAGRKLDWTYSEQNRIGDHRWWISDLVGVRARPPRLVAALLGRGHPAPDPRRERGALGAGVNLSVVIPAHNEAEVVEPTLRGLIDQLGPEGIDYEIVVVDDASTRRHRRRRARRVTAEEPRVRCVRNEAPNGFGFAVRKGLEAFRGDAVVIVMADGSDDPRDVVLYYRVLEAGYDCAFGSRFMPGAQVHDYPRSSCR